MLTFNLSQRVPPAGELIRRSWNVLWALANVQILEGGRLPSLHSFRKLPDGDAQTVFRIFPRFEILLEPFSEVLVPLHLRILIDYPGNFHFDNPKKLREDRPHIQISPCVQGREIRYISNLSVVISNNASWTECITPAAPLLEITTFTRPFETPLRPCRKITCEWRTAVTGRSYPVYIVNEPLVLPYF